MFVNLQVSAKLQQISDRCDLYQENGQITSPTLDRRIDFHFNAMLDNVAEWRKDKNEKHDVNLMGKYYNSLFYWKVSLFE